MQLTLLAAGTRLPAWINAGFDEYARRLPRQMRLDLREIPVARRSATHGVAQCMREEAEHFRKRLHAGALVVTLEVTGKALSTESLAAQVGRWRDDGRDANLLIGGPDGLQDDVLALADLRWSVSPLTLPHGLVRVIVAEQLYRAWSVLEGHPYHRGGWGGLVIYLASKSPRRRELLAQLGLEFEVIDVEVDERAESGESAGTLVERLAQSKAVAGKAHAPAGARVIGADTMVVLEGVALGKPRDRADAAGMLQRLSGREHIVMSGLALATDAGVMVTRSDTSVQFIHLDMAQIDAYLDTDEPYDKAGAYAIQGRAAAFVARIEGSYSGVVGMPLHLLARLLAAPIGEASR